MERSEKKEPEQASAKDTSKAQKKRA